MPRKTIDDKVRIAIRVLGGVSVVAGAAGLYLVWGARGYGTGRIVALCVTAVVFGLPILLVNRSIMELEEQWTEARVRTKALIIVASMVAVAAAVYCALRWYRVF